MAARAVPGVRSAFSLIEVLIAVAVLAGVATIGVMAMNRAGENTAESKLTADVSALNAATQMYIASGGDLGSVATPNDALTKMKTVATSAQSKTMINPMTGSVIDRRLVAEMQSAAEAASGAPRAYWNTTDHAWEVKTTGGVGVKRFVLDNALASVMVQTEARDGGTMEFASTDGWVWDHDVWAEDARLTPTGIATTAFPDPPPSGGTATGGGDDGGGSGGDDDEEEPPAAPRLPRPTLDRYGGGYPAEDYPMMVSVTNAGVYSTNGTLRYRVGSGAWTAYTGPIAVTSGTTLRFVAFSNDPEAWQNSYQRYAHYYTKKPPRLPTPVLDKVGGPYISTDYPLTVTVLNAATYPDSATLKYQQNSGPWLNYIAGMSVPPDTTLRVQAFTDDPAAHRDSYQVSEYYFSVASSFSGYTVGEYDNIEGGPNLVYSLTDDDSFLSHGRSTIEINGEYIDAGEANTLKFLSSNFSGVLPGQEFPIGEILYHNGTTFDNSHATEADLNIEIVFTSPSKTTKIKIPLDLINTENTSDPDASADFVRLADINKTYKIKIDGSYYDLSLSFGTSDVNGFTTASQFHVYEGATARGELHGVMVRRSGGGDD